jgi:hypothetical protein
VGWADGPGDRSLERQLLGPFNRDEASVSQHDAERFRVIAGCTKHAASEIEFEYCVTAAMQNLQDAESFGVEHPPGDPSGRIQLGQH